GEGFAEMTGGKGRDLFVVSNGGRFAHAVITDFAPRADRIVIDRAGGYGITDAEPRASAAVPDGLQVLRNDAAALHLGMRFTNVYGVSERYFVHYDRATGTLTGQVAAQGLRIEDYDLVAEIDGAPRLTAAHFLLTDF
ncbi:MAG: hypothetical protein ACK4OP_13160, partial [Gemmobacter sp.]